MRRIIAALLAAAAAADPALQQRRAALLHQLRHDTPLQALESAWAPGEALHVADANATSFRCTARAAAAADEAAEDADEPAEDAGDPLLPLSDMCAQLHMGWWTYEWCHQRHVRQMHIGESGAADPVWSLGEFAGRAEAEGEEELVDRFVGGQFCDETGEGRATDVVFRCCEPPRRRGGKGRDLVRLQSVTEPATCAYQLTVCTPLACARAPDAGALTVDELLLAIDGACFQRHEGWWSYEVCFGASDKGGKKKRVRQFHTEQRQLEDGSSAVETTAEFSLGALVAGPGELRRDEDDPAGSEVVFEYEGGTACDLRDSSRATTVKLRCGASNAFVSVEEDHTCHYTAVVTTPALCEHEAFRAEEPAVVGVECVSA